VTTVEKRVWLGIAVFLLIVLPFMLGYLVGDAAWIAPIKNSIIQMVRGPQ
jgi:hypothetical protein